MKTLNKQRRTNESLRSHAVMRTDAYVLLGALLTTVPSQERISLIQNMSWEEDLPEPMHRALTSLKHAGEICSTRSIIDEYNRIFIGLGSGELVPYASWYQEKMIQSTPLARIRNALRHLGIIRQEESFESEDHAGSLCEIMALLSMPGNSVTEQEQITFFFDHIGSWMGNFFVDLQKIRDAVFYPAVGSFGQCFLETESDYLTNMTDY